MKRKKRKPVNFRFTAVYLSFFLIFFLGIANLILGGKWNGESRYTIVVNSPSPVIYSVEPRVKRAVIFTISGNALLDVPFGYDLYPASSVYKLGELDKGRGGGLLLKKSVESTLGMIINSYLSLPQGFDIGPRDKEEISVIKDRYFSLKSLPGLLSLVFGLDPKIRSDMSKADLYRFWNSMRLVRADKISLINLESNGIYSSELWPDGSVVNMVDKDKFDVMAAEYFEDQNIRSQNISLEIVNASDKEKVAAQFSRLMVKVGARIPLISTSQDPEDFHCLIRLSDKSQADFDIITLLRNQFSCILDKGYIPKGQAEAKVILGKQFIK